jgi:hypothetical protein
MDVDNNSKEKGDGSQAPSKNNENVMSFLLPHVCMPIELDVRLQCTVSITVRDHHKQF